MTTTPQTIGGPCTKCGRPNLEHAGGLCPLNEPYPLAAADPIVGHKTYSDGTGGYRHEPLRRSEADAYIAAAEAAQAKRAADMPTEEDAARAMWSAWQRLRELGWRETMYGPTNERVRTVSPGSAGIHIGSRHDPWPEKTWWIEDGGDLWPGNPCLFKPLA